MYNERVFLDLFFLKLHKEERKCPKIAMFS